MKPHRVQLSRRKGWKMPANTVKVDRSTRWGNPYRVKGCSAETSVRAFESELTWYLSGKDCIPSKTVEIREALKTLRGKNLACWCPLGQPCHADVLLELANK
jgi:hypothetical protein